MYTDEVKICFVDITLARSRARPPALYRRTVVVSLLFVFQFLYAIVPVLCCACVCRSFSLFWCAPLCRDACIVCLFIQEGRPPIKPNNKNFKLTHVDTMALVLVLWKKSVVCICANRDNSINRLFCSFCALVTSTK